MRLFDRWVFAWTIICSFAAAVACTAEENQPASSTSAAGAADWPQYHGPRRDNMSTETGLLKRWPAGGPRLIWRAAGAGSGFSSPAIAGGMIYLTGNIGKNTVITAMDIDGVQLWQTPNGPAYRRNEPGTRSTPTVAGGKLYHLNADGDLVCLNAKTGERTWGFNIIEKFKGRNVRWALAESPLVDGQKVICRPGGKEIAMVALDKDTGKTIWMCKGIDDKPGYSSAILVQYQGIRQIVALMTKHAVGVSADSGKLLWKYHHPVRYDQNILRPIFHQGRLVIAGGLGAGTTLLKLHVKDSECSVEGTWHNKDLDNQHGGIILVDGYLYGHARLRRNWVCVELATGKTMYTSQHFKAQSICQTYADGMLYLVTADHTVALLPPDPKGFHPASTFKLPGGSKGSSWAFPVVCGGRLYIRHDDNLYAYDVRAK